MNDKKVLTGIIVILALGLGVETVFFYQAKTGEKPYRNSINQNAIAVPVSRHMMRTRRADPRVTEWDPLAQMQQIQRTMDRMMGSSLSATPIAMSLGPVETVSVFTPSADIRKTDQSYIVTMDLPGMDKQNINVDVANNVLTVSGERKADKEERDKADHLYVQERTFGQFARSIALPSDAKADKIEAVYANGVLTLTIPRQATQLSKSTQTKIEVK